jgi:hypothetical protein
MGITAKQVQRSNCRIGRAEISEEIAGGATVVAGGIRMKGSTKGIDRASEDGGQ